MKEQDTVGLKTRSLIERERGGYFNSNGVSLLGIQQRREEATDRTEELKNANKEVQKQVEYSEISNSIFNQKYKCIKTEGLPEVLPVTESEIYTVIGLFMLMGIIQKPTIRFYFSKGRVISTPGVADVMSRDRFESICRFLHFVNNSISESFQGSSKIF